MSYKCDSLHVISTPCIFYIIKKIKIFSLCPKLYLAFSYTVGVDVWNGKDHPQAVY